MAKLKVWALEYDDGDYYRSVVLLSLHATADGAKAQVPTDNLTDESEWRWVDNGHRPGWEVNGRSEQVYFVTEYEVGD